MKRYVIPGVIGIGLCFFITNRFIHFIPGIPEALGATISYPFTVAQQWLVNPIRRLMTERRTNKQLTDALLCMRAERDALRGQLIAATSQLTFYKDTQDVRDYAQRYDTHQAILAQVFLVSCTQQQQYMIVGAGSRHGVVVDMVAVHTNCLVGRVTDVWPTMSRVALITDGTCKIAATTDQSGSQGIFQGSNRADQARLDHVSHLSPIHVGEMVISSGHGLVFPQGFGLGRIIELEVQGLEHQVTVEPLLDLSRLKYAYLMSK